MIIELNIKNLENIPTLDKTKVVEIVEALIVSGGLTGVKGGQTIIHFDHQGAFKSVQLSYYPWVKR